MKWIIDIDGIAGMEEQAAQLCEDIGTDREWVAIGIADNDGLAEVIALSHPTNAALIAAAPELLAVLKELCEKTGSEAAFTVREKAFRIIKKTEVIA